MLAGMGVPASMPTSLDCMTETQAGYKMSNTDRASPCSRSQELGCFSMCLVCAIPARAAAHSAHR